MSKPVKEFKLPFSNVRCAIFENINEKGTTLSYKFQKSYKDKVTDDWKNTEFFNESDLRDLIALATGMAFKQITCRDVVEKADEKGKDELGF